MAENANASFPPLSDVVSSALHALNDFHYTEPHLINHLQQQQQQHHLYAASQPANSTFTQLSSPPVGYSQPPLQISTVQPPSLKRPRLQDAMYNQASYVQGPSSMSYIANMPSYNIPTGNRYSPLASDPDPDPDPEQGVANNNSPPHNQSRYLLSLFMIHRFMWNFYKKLRICSNMKILLLKSEDHILKSEQVQSKTLLYFVSTCQRKDCTITPTGTRQKLLFLWCYEMFQYPIVNKKYLKN